MNQIRTQCVAYQSHKFSQEVFRAANAAPFLSCSSRNHSNKLIKQNRYINKKKIKIISSINNCRINKLTANAILKWLETKEFFLGNRATCISFHLYMEMEIEKRTFSWIVSCGEVWRKTDWSYLCFKGANYFVHDLFQALDS